MKKEFFIVAVLLTFFLLSGLYYAVTNSITSDEVSHITAGYVNLRFNDYRFNIEHPPLVKQLAALPLLFLKLNFPFDVYRISSVPMDIVKIQDAFLFNIGNNLDIILLLSRIPNMLISVFLGFLIYRWSRKINGVFAGVLSLALFVFSPSFLGHSPLVTMDTTVSCFYFATIYFLMRFIESRENKFLTLTGIFLGLSLISKFSALVLIPVIYMLVLLYAFSSIPQEHKLKNYLLLSPILLLACSYKSSFKFVAPALFVFIFFSIFIKKAALSVKARYACAILLIILVIAFTFIILDYTDFKWFPLHGATKAYFKGFSSFEGHAKVGQGDAYLLGEHSSKGWWYYFPLAFIFKEPFAFLIIFLFGLALFFLKKEDMISKYLLLVPALAYLFASMFMNKVNVGIRHVLPVYPFLYVVAGYGVIIAKRFRYIKYTLFLLLIVLAVDVLTAYPAHLSYFNRLLGGTGNGYKYLSDSNIAWGQDWKRAEKYVKDNNIKKAVIEGGYTFLNCDYYKIPCRKFTEQEKKLPGNKFYIIEATALVSGRIAWANRVKPIKRIGGSLLAYNITGKDISLLEAK